jgi:tetratricopeptide (TPR) repeat protein
LLLLTAPSSFRRVFGGREDSPPGSPLGNSPSDYVVKELTGRPSHHQPITPSPASRKLKGSKKGARAMGIKGWLKVTVGQGRGLESVWADGSAPPSLFLSLEVSSQLYRTRVVIRDMVPVWNSNFIFDIFKAQLSVDGLEEQTPPELVVRLFHRSSAVQKTLLGSCTVTDVLTFIAPSTVWVPIQVERFSNTGNAAAMDTKAEIQLSLQFMPGKEEGENAEKQRQEQVTRDLRRDWVLSQKLINRQDVETIGSAPGTLRGRSRFVDEVSSHGELEEEGFEADLSEYVIVGSAPSLSTSSFAADGGYVGTNESMDESLFLSSFKDDLALSSSDPIGSGGGGGGGGGRDESIHLSGSGESFSEDSNHYVKVGAKIPVKPGSVANFHNLRGSGGNSNNNNNNNNNNNSSSDSVADRKGSSLSDLGDFNERFQQTVEKMRSLDPSDSNFVERLTCNINIVDLAQDFLYSASAYGKIIISEYHVPNHLKTIKEATMGGFLGGKKFLVRNILFKFATDETGFFQSHKAASKVAGNELRGLISYFDSSPEGLSFPLMCLLDFKGYRLVCSSYLPISGQETLVYGSSNGGKDFVNNSPKMYDAVTESSHVLNLKPHLIGKDEDQWAISSPCDLEGHIGKDGRQYLLDFSRYMPPIRASKEFVPWKAPNMHLYRLFRPEFVQTYSKQLCADAFSGFMDNSTPSYEEDHLEVKEATRHLITNCIPEFAKHLCKLVTEEARLSADGSISQFRLTEALHRSGINVCFLGKVYEYPLLSKLMPQIKDLILCECIARVLKNLIRFKMRERARELTVPLEKPFVYLVIQVLNDVFGNTASNPTTEMYWKRFIPARLGQDFCFKFLPGDLFKRVQNIVFLRGSSLSASSSGGGSSSGSSGVDSNSNNSGSSSINNNNNAMMGDSSSEDTRSMLRSSMGDVLTDVAKKKAPMTGFYLILQRLISMLGLTFTDKVLEDLRENSYLFGAGTPCFDNSDLLQLGERVKHLSVVSLARGFVLVFKGHKAAFLKDYVSCLRYYEMALVAYEAALDSTPNDSSLLRSYAKVYWEIERAVLARDNLQRRKLKDSPYLTRADLFYRLSLSANNNAYAFAQYAVFLEYVREFDKAEQHYLQALTIDPNDIYCLRKYSVFLQEVRQNIDLGEKFLKRANENQKCLLLLKEGEEPQLTDSGSEIKVSKMQYDGEEVAMNRVRPRSRSEDSTGPEPPLRMRSFSHKDLRHTHIAPLSRILPGAAVRVPLEIVCAENNTVHELIVPAKNE